MWAMTPRNPLETLVFDSPVNAPINQSFSVYSSLKLIFYPLYCIARKQKMMLYFYWVSCLHSGLYFHGLPHSFITWSSRSSPLSFFWRFPVEQYFRPSIFGHFHEMPNQRRLRISIPSTMVLYVFISHLRPHLGYIVVPYILARRLK